MFNFYFITLLFLIPIIYSCNNSIQTTDKSVYTNEAKTENQIDSQFDIFLDKFSTDSTFQLNRTKFPLKIVWYDSENDTVFYRTQSKFEPINLSKQNALQNKHDWTQKIVIKNTIATVEITGVENGIMVNYFFKKIKGKWTLISIEDSST